MTWLVIILGILLVLIGLAGSLLPALPGPPVAYAGLVLQQLREPNPFSTNFLLGWLAAVAIVVFLDYYIPIWGTKKFGGSKYGVWGCTLGFIAAFWLGPLGVIIGPFMGAFLGELLSNKPANLALKAAFGAFLGFLGGSFIKIAVCVVMGFYIVKTI